MAKRERRDRQTHKSREGHRLSGQRIPASAWRMAGPWCAALALLLLAGALRSYRLALPDLWIDEANGVIIAQQSLPDLIGRLRLDSSPPLYYFILRAWMHVCGNGEAAVRALSVIAGISVVGVVFLVGRRLFSRQVAWFAAVLIAVSPVQVYYSQQARMYSLLPLAALLSAYWLWRAVSDGRRYSVAVYAIATLAALYLHNGALYLLPAHLAVLLWSGALRKRPVPWVMCAVSLVAGYSPWLPILLQQLGNKTHYSWFLPFWQQSGVTGSLVQTLGSFAPGGPQPPYLRLAGLARYAWLPVVVSSFAAAVSVVQLLRLRPGAAERRPGICLLMCLCIPLAAALGASWVVTPNYVPGRSDQMVFPFFVLLVAVGLSAIRPTFLRYAVLAVLLASSAVSLRAYYNSELPPSDRALAQAIAAHAAPGDAVLTTSLTRAPVEYYLGRNRTSVRFFSYPRSTALHLGNQDDAALLENPGRNQEDIRLLKKEIKQQCGEHARVFLVLAETPVNEALYVDLIRSERSRIIAEFGPFSQAVTGIPVVVLQFQFSP